MGEVVAFPSRVAQVHAHEAGLPSGNLVKWRDEATGVWVVDHVSASGDSIAMVGRFEAEAEADEFIADGAADPLGAA